MGGRARLHRRGASQVLLGAITEVPLGAVRRRHGGGREVETRGAIKAVGWTGL